MAKVKGRDFKRKLLVFSSIIIVFIMLSQVAFSSVNGSSVTSKRTMGKSANVNDITSFTNSSSSIVGYVKYTLFLSNNTLLKGNVIGKGTGGVPIAIAYDSANNYIYVCNSMSNNVSVINDATNLVIASISVGRWPDAVAYDSANNYIYVANSWSNNTSVINGTTNSVIGSIKVGSAPDAVAYDCANNYIYVCNVVSDNVSVINGYTNSVISSISVGHSPVGVAYDSVNNYLYVANVISSNVSVINGANNSVIATINEGTWWPYAIAYDPFNNYVYVTNGIHPRYLPPPWPNNVSVINGATNSVISIIGVGLYPEAIASDPSNNYIFVCNSVSNNVSVINGATNSVISSISVGSWPTGMAYDCANNYLYVANSGSNSISIISASVYENNSYSLLIGVIAIVIVVALMTVGFVMGIRKIKDRY